MNDILNFDIKNIYLENTLPAKEDEKIVYIFRDTTLEDDGMYHIHRILYIGKSLDSASRLNINHDKIAPAKKMLPKNHFLTFAYHKFHGNTENEHVISVENALIFTEKPPLNIDYVDSYLHEDIKLTIIGERKSLLPDSIELKKGQTEL